MDNSRTKKSIKNSGVALVFFAVNFILLFFSRKVFLDYLGEDILGLSSTTQNVLNFLNIAELGISYAVSFTLYKPIFDNDKEAICEIVDLQRYLYRKVAAVLIIGGIVLMLFFPIIFAKIKLPLWYAYACFIVFMISALLGYFVNFRQIVLTASQLDYKVQYSFKLTQMLKLVAQMCAMFMFRYHFLWWLGIELLFSILASYALHRMTMRTFPWLRSSKKKYNELKERYPDFLKKIKQLFYHKISGLALSQTSPIIIYAYTKLAIVAIYGNYMIVVSGISQLIGALFNSFSAGIGNLVAENNNERIWAVFKELFSLRFYISAVVCFTLLISARSLIIAWIGDQYLFPFSTVVLICAVLFINLSRSIVDSFIGAYGLYHDIFAPIVEAILNISLSILLGFFYGINGIICGVFLSLFIIILLWKPYFLFTRSMQGHLFDYVKIYLLHLFLMIVAGVISLWIFSQTKILYSNVWMKFIITASFVFVLFSSIYLILLVVFKTGIVQFLSRMKRLLIR